MKLDALVNELSLEVVSGGDLNRDISGCFICDLLSHAMGKVETDNLWITVQTNMNIIAIAVLTELSAIIVAQGMDVGEDVINRANDEGVTLLRSEKTAYELALMIGERI